MIDLNEQSYLADAVIEVVENQINDNNPPKVRQTLDRLLGLGISRDEALKHIGCALSVEMFGVINNSEPFDQKRYDRNLDNLPELPWENE